MAYLDELKSEAALAKTIDIVVAPVAPVLFAACEKTRDTPFLIAAQNVFYEKQGAFTGEWSVEHLLELGCGYAIVGHSERRQYFGETDESVAKKVKACLDGGIVPIACVGETLEQRQKGQVADVLNRQTGAAVSLIKDQDATQLVVAYEPVWAIGTGLTATADAAQQAHELIRNKLSSDLGPQVAQKIRILYGGSVKADNAAELAKEPDIDGALIGGASLNAQTFITIAKEVAKARAR